LSSLIMANDICQSK